MFRAFISFLAAAFFSLPLSIAAADGIFPYEDHIRNALPSGGHIALSGSGVVALAEPLVVTADTILDAGSNTVTFSGADQTRVIQMAPGIKLTLINITIAHGRATKGAAVLNDGGSLTAIGCTFLSNTVVGATGAVDQAGELVAGGAIYSEGSLVLRDGTFIGNTALGGTGGHGFTGEKGPPTNSASLGGPGAFGGSASGGAVLARGIAVISNCIFIANSARAGTGGAGGTGGENNQILTGGARGGEGGPGGNANGGAVHILGTASIVSTIFEGNESIGGTGGYGGSGGVNYVGSRDTAYFGSHGGDSGPAGSGGHAAGAALFLEDGEIQVRSSHFGSNHALGGVGPRGTMSGFTFEGRHGHGGPGGHAIGGAACIQAGQAYLDRCSFSGNLTEAGPGGSGASSHQYGYMFRPAQAGAGASGGRAEGTLFNRGVLYLAASTFSSNIVSGGNGGAGGLGGRPQARTGSSGDNGASGGSASGAAVAQFHTANIVNCTFFANECRAGSGGPGGKSGWGTLSVPLFGGDGGHGGNASGGALWTAPDSLSTIQCATLASNLVIAGSGAPGGAGYPSYYSRDEDGRHGNPGTADGANIAAEGLVKLRNSILANDGTNTQVTGLLRDQGRNLCSDTSCGFNDRTSLSDADPMLDPLADNGGPTLTMLPRPGSPVINAGSRRNLLSDQRGFIRSQRDAPDIGALDSTSVAGAAISGRVIASDGTGLAGIVVKLGSHTTRTDAAGQYEFTGLKPARYVLRPGTPGRYTPTRQRIYATNNSTAADFTAP